MNKPSDEGEEKERRDKCNFGVMDASVPAECCLEKKEHKLKEFIRRGMLVGSERFCEDVGCLFQCGNVFEIDLICIVDFANVVITSIDMFSARVIDIVLRVIESSFRVGEDCDRGLDGNVDRFEELEEKDGFLCGIHSFIHLYYPRV